ncbi:MAG TPA: thioredoxin [Polyangiaceae bacterium]|nr:thioredoxin [Polyangiaceae bacterium]
MKLQQVTEQDFEPEVLVSELPVLVEFGATWCGPCKVVEPELQALAQEYAGRAKVVKVDIDQSPFLARQLGIQSVPTFLVFHQGRPVNGKAGAMKKAQLAELIEPLLPRAAGALKPKEVAQLLRQGHVTLVDVRPAEVYRRAHIKGAINLPVAELSARVEEVLDLPSSPVLYCRTGADSKAAAAELAAQGTPVAFLEGGVLGWEGDGFMLDRPS